MKGAIIPKEKVRLAKVGGIVPGRPRIDLNMQRQDLNLGNRQ